MKKLLILATLVAWAPVAFAELPPLIPRDVLFSAAEFLTPSVSPDGKRIAWLAPDDNHVQQIWMRPLDGGDAKQLSHEKKRPIYQYAWADDNSTILYQQDSDGDENWHLYAIDVATGNVRDLTPWQGIHLDAFRTDRKRPHEVLVGLNLRDRRFIDMHRIDLRTGAVTLDTRNPGDVVAFIADADMVVRGAQATTPEGGHEIRWRADAKSPWRVLVRTGPDEVVELVDFSADGKSVIMRTSIGSDKVRLVERNLATGAQKELASDDEVDVDNVVIHPTRHVVQAAAFEKATREWKFLDKTFEADFEQMTKLGDGAVALLARDHADRVWIAEFMSDHGPIQYYAFDRASKKGTFIAVHRPKLKGLVLAPMKGVSITARDGLKLAGYLTLPQGVEAKNLPLVLFPHGGPWARDTWGYNRDVQLLANRGYAVLAGELSRLDRLRQEIPARGRSSMGTQDARRPRRCRAMGGRRGHCRSEARRDLRRLVRRLLGARRRDVLARCVSLLGRHLRCVQSHDVHEIDSAVLDGVPLDPPATRWRSRRSERR